METINKNLMKNKTAMMELIDFLWKYKQAGINEPDAIKEKAKMLLEKEKEQIMQAYDEIPLENFNGAEDYYNQTYLKDSNETI